MSATPRAKGPSLTKRLMTRAHAVWLSARDPRCPWPARMLGFAVAAYALSPIDLIPDFIPVIGLLDDAVLIPLGVWLVARLIPDELWAEHLAQAEAAAMRPPSRAGIVIVVLVWIAALVGTVVLLAPLYD